MLHRPLLAALAMLCLAYAEQAPWAPKTTVAGEPYYAVEELRSFYKLSTGVKNARKGAYAIGNADVTLELGPGTRELRIGGLRLELSRPMQKDAAGAWLISQEDWVSCIDPILRPTYILGRTPVQTVVIDAGHGGHDSGAPLPQGSEAQVALQIAHKLKAELEKLGYQTLLTRSEPVFVSDRQRVQTANAAGANAIFISLHINQGRSDYKGASVYTLAPGQDARPGHARQQAHAALAYALQSALVARAGAADAGSKHAHYSLLSSITCPAVWVELGYGTHAQEGAALASADYQATLAQALAQGIATYAAVANPDAKIPVHAAPPRTPVKQPVATPTKTPEPQRSSTATRGKQTTTTRGKQSTGASATGRQQSSGRATQSSSGRRPSTPANRTRR